MTILFYPQLPKEHNRVFKACKELGYDFHNNPERKFDLAFFWSFTLDKYKPDLWAKKRKNMVNRGCFDITKSRVANHFESLLINPETFEGTAVKKSEKQARHDGELIKCPSKRENGFVYQKNIDTKRGSEFTDIRIFWSGNIDFVLLKRKTLKFKTDLVHVDEIKKEDCFSKDELKMIENGCMSFGLDFGEVDAIRDVSTGELAIIDVNNISGRGVFERFPKYWTLYLNSFKAFVESRANLNGFSIGHNTLSEIKRRATKHVLELGSGKGSAEIAKHFKLTSIEDQGKFVGKYKGGKVFHVPIKDGWYDLDILKSVISKIDYDFILMDAPANNPRIGFFDNFDIFKKVPFIIDDTHREQGKDLVKLFESKGFVFKEIKEVDKTAAVWDI